MEATNESTKLQGRDAERAIAHQISFGAVHRSCNRDVAKALKGALSAIWT
jgi:hypothetical protein